VNADLEVYRRAFRDVPNCRLATIDPVGAPHVAPRWFVWLEDGLFVATRRTDASWDNVERDPRVSVVVDQGRDWTDLSGVRVDGAAEAIPAEHPETRGVMSAWHEKYRSLLAGDGFERLTEQVVGLGFLRVEASAVHAWDHRAG
jgi:nitroimidazol reductase NimA-like FMN-containing flavoprotein (pyridoxamine 5'-phosphate oxidase superfamily)